MTLGFLLSVDCFVGAVGAGVFAVVTFTHGQNLSAIPRHAPIILEWKKARQEIATAVVSTSYACAPRIGS